MYDNYSFEEVKMSFHSFPHTFLCLFPSILPFLRSFGEFLRATYPPEDWPGARRY
jgi:hypothetical protein